MNVWEVTDDAGEVVNRMSMDDPELLRAFELGYRLRMVKCPEIEQEVAAHGA